MAVQMPEVHVQIGLEQAANPDSWVLGTGALGSTTALGEALTYTYYNVGTDMRSISITRGKSNERGEYQAGTARIVLDNRSRNYDPLNLDGDFASGGVTWIKPGRPIYIEFQPDSFADDTYRIFTGRIRKWELDYTGGFDSTATILCSDAMAELNTTTVDLTTSASDTGTNAAEVLVDAGLTNFTTSTGSTSTQAMTFSGTALAALRVLEKSEQGALYVEANGDIVFSTRTALVDETRSNTSQATFNGSGDPLDTTHIAFEYDGDSDVRNSVKATRQGGSEQQATNQDSIDAYGVKAYSLTGLANVSDSSALGLAEYIAARYGDVYARISEITIKPMTDSSLMLQACTRRIRDRVTVNFTPVGGGDPISQEAHIIGIKHSIDQLHRFATTFQLESATPADAVWRLGFGALDSTTVLSF